MEYSEQLNLWLKGDSVHNTKKGICCPDFSCCNPKIKTPDRIKKEFADAYYKDDFDTQNRIAMGFLGQMLANKGGKSKGKKVYITG